MTKWIKKDDNVVVIAGNDKGKTGTVLKRDGDKILIKGVNVRKKHIKRTQKNQQSQIAYIELPELGETKILKLAIIQEQQILDRF